MAETPVETPDPSSAVMPSEPAGPRRRGKGAARASESSSMARRIVTALASLKLTVVLFALGIALVLFGTLAQVDEGIWTVVNNYFRRPAPGRLNPFVWVPLQIFFPRAMQVSGGFPFPGGWLIGGLLLANLLAAHAVRFKLSWKRTGIFLIHLGLIVLMLSELVTGVFAVEGNMTIEEGRSSNYVEDTGNPELAIVAPSEQGDDVVVVSGSSIRRGGLIQHDLLPVDIQVHRYMTNSVIERVENHSGHENPANEGAGLTWLALDRPEVSGADPDQTVDLASAYVTFKEKDTSRPLGTYLLSLWLEPQPLTVGEKQYEVSLRFKRMYKPYTIHLYDFNHEVYPGTEVAKDFSSHVRLIDPVQNEDREVLIYMNHPLRHAGETFYQSSFLKGDIGTVLQVVRNPGWLMPYIACTMVSLGMLVHFGMHLFGFLRRRTAK